MITSQHPPIYTASYAFVREVYRIKIKLPRALKYDLGQEEFSSALKILKCIVLTNRSQDKSRHISRLLLEVEVQWTFLRLLFDLRGITEGEFRVLSESSDLAPLGLKQGTWTPLLFLSASEDLSAKI